MVSDALFEFFWIFVDKVAVYAQEGDSVEGEDDEDTVVENEDVGDDADQAVTEKEKVIYVYIYLLGYEKVHPQRDMMQLDHTISLEQWIDWGCYFLTFQLDEVGEYM